MAHVSLLVFLHSDFSLQLINLSHQIRDLTLILQALSLSQLIIQVRDVLGMELEFIGSLVVG